MSVLLQFAGFIMLVVSLVLFTGKRSRFDSNLQRPAEVSKTTAPPQPAETTQKK